MSVNPIRRGRNGTAVAKLVFGAVLLLLNGCTAFSQIRTGRPEETLQRRVNATACGYSLSGCDESQLTPAEIVQVFETRRRVNVTACGYGFSHCNESQLGKTEMAEVNATRRRVNVTACGYGFSSCDESRLTASESTQVKAIRRRINTVIAGQGYRPTAAVLPRPATSPAVPLATSGAAENGSYYGELNKNGVPKTVHVDGYFKSNGTYVRGYYRSAPGTDPFR